MNSAALSILLFMGSSPFACAATPASLFTHTLHLFLVSHGVALPAAQTQTMPLASATAAASKSSFLLTPPSHDSTQTPPQQVMASSTVAQPAAVPASGPQTLLVVPAASQQLEAQAPVTSASATQFTVQLPVVLTTGTQQVVQSVSAPSGNGVVVQPPATSGTTGQIVNQIVPASEVQQVIQLANVPTTISQPPAPNLVQIPIQPPTQAASDNHAIQTAGAVAWQPAPSVSTVPSASVPPAAQPVPQPAKEVTSEALPAAAVVNAQQNGVQAQAPDKVPTVNQAAPRSSVRRAIAPLPGLVASAGPSAQPVAAASVSAVSTPQSSQPAAPVAISQVPVVVADSPSRPVGTNSQPVVELAAGGNVAATTVAAGEVAINPTSEASAPAVVTVPTEPAATSALDKVYQLLSACTFAVVVKGLCMLSNIMVQLSPYSTVKHWQSKGCTGEADAAPYVSIAFGGWQWCFYGAFAFLITERSGFLILVYSNCLGAVLGSYYTYSFLQNCKDSRSMMGLQKYLSATAAMVAFQVCACMLLPAERALFLCGLVSSFCGFVGAFSLLVTVPKTIRTQDASSISGPLIVANFLSAWVWILCGWMLEDSLVLVPNVVSAIAAATSMFLKYKYDFKTPSKDATASKAIDEVLRLSNKTTTMKALEPRICKSMPRKGSDYEQTPLLEPVCASTCEKAFANYPAKAAPDKFDAESFMPECDDTVNSACTGGTW